jgi:hypothetical protein
METMSFSQVVRNITFSQLGQSVGVRMHPILKVIERLLAGGWVGGQESGTVSGATADVDCFVS